MTGGLRRRDVPGAAGWALLALCWLLAGCATLPPPPPEPGAEPAIEIAVVRRTWHTDVAVPADRLSPPLSGLNAAMPGARWLVLGFGESSYLRNRAPGFADMLMALLPGPGAVLLTGLRATPAEAFGAANVQPLRVSARGFARLQEFLWRSLATRHGRVPEPLADGPYPGSLFYASALTYAGYYTCNTWTAEALAQAGLPLGAEGVLLAGQVMGRARHVAAP